MSIHDYRPPCPKCKRNVKNYFDHTTIDCKKMDDDEISIRMEYHEYLKDRYKSEWKDDSVMSFDDWWRSKADEAKDRVKYQD